MLSIEKGKVYTEKFCLNHIIKTAYSSQTKNSQDMQSSLETCRICCHRHILLTRYAIPEESFVPADADRYSGVASGRLKLPLPPLLQSSVLLI
jgi:hypothetical protein